MQYSKAIIAKAFFEKISPLGVQSVNDFIEQIKLFQSASQKLSLNQLFKNPLLEEKDREKLLREICSKLNISEAFVPYFIVIVELKALKSIKNIVSTLQKLRQKKFSLTEGIAVSASKLSSLQQKEVISIIKKISNCENVILTEEIQTHTLGGVTISVDDQWLDVTLKNKLNTLSKIIS